MPGPSEPLRILLFAPTSVVGGIATWTRYFLAGCDRSRLLPEVVDTSKKYEAIGSERNLRGTLLGCIHGLSLLASLVRLAAARRPALAYFTCAGSWSLFTRDLALIRLSRLLGMRTLVHLRGGDPAAVFGRDPLTRWLSRRALGGADTVVLLTRSLEARARDLFPAKAKYLPNMVDDAVFAAAAAARPPRVEGVFRVLHLATQSPAKGTYDILEAFRLIKDSHPALVADLVGKAAPEHEAEIDRRIREYGLGGRVRLHPEISGDARWEFFRAADLFLFPSHTEGFPNVVLEAMAFGLPVIATDVGNIREMIGWEGDAPAGVLLEGSDPVSPPEIAAHLARMAGDATECARLGAQGRHRVKSEYSTHAVIPKIEAIIFATVTGG